MLSDSKLKTLVDQMHNAEDCTDHGTMELNFRYATYILGIDTIDCFLHYEKSKLYLSG